MEGKISTERVIERQKILRNGSHGKEHAKLKIRSQEGRVKGC